MFRPRPNVNWEAGRRDGMSRVDAVSETLVYADAQEVDIAIQHDQTGAVFDAYYVLKEPLAQLIPYDMPLMSA